MAEGGQLEFCAQLRTLRLQSSPTEMVLPSSSARRREATDEGQDEATAANAKRQTGQSDVTVGGDPPFRRGPTYDWRIGAVYRSTGLASVFVVMIDSSSCILNLSLTSHGEQ